MPSTGWCSPALERFRHEMIVVAARFDASGADPLGRMIVSAAGFGRLAARMMEVAGALCGGRLVLSHEGNHSPMYVPFGLGRAASSRTRRPVTKAAEAAGL